MTARRAGRAVATVLAALAACAVARDARAQWLPELRPTAADSPSACAALVRQEARAVLGRGDALIMAGIGESAGLGILLGASAFLPNVGVRARPAGDAPAAIVSWPFSLPFGPVTACTRAGLGVDEFPPLRLVLEPGMAIGSSFSAFVRPGLRAIWHRSLSRLGLGLGFGSTLAWTGYRRGGVSLSPELLFHIGRCCRPGYWLVALRADRYVAGDEPTTLLATLGIAFW